MKLQENNIHFQNFYNIGVHQIQIPDINLKELIKNSYKVKNLNDSVLKSNKGGYQSEGNLHINPLFYPLVNILNQCHSLITKQPNSIIREMWLNISSFGDYNNLHTHGSDLFKLSGVIYLQVPENSGKIQFCNPIDLNLGWPYAPLAGDLLIFPQMIPHLVEPNLSQEDRISIAFNYE